jgi:DNA polymerase delta subunit 2
VRSPASLADLTLALCLHSFLGTSGQNIDNIEKLSTLADKLDIMHRTLEWRHLAPTAPHTLCSPVPPPESFVWFSLPVQLPACFPFDETTGDPFVIETLPHVYFVGNQPSFGTVTLTGQEGRSVVIILAPSFAQTSTAVLVNLLSLAVTPVSFSVAPI